MDGKEFITPQEIADELRVTPNAVSAWLRKGLMRGIKVGKYWRIRPEDYRAFLNEQTNVRSDVDEAPIRERPTDRSAPTSDNATAGWD